MLIMIEIGLLIGNDLKTCSHEIFVVMYKLQIEQEMINTFLYILHIGNIPLQTAYGMTNCFISMYCMFSQLHQT
jgi:hypothetical protein